MTRRRYELAIQTTLPAAYRSDRSFIQELETLQELGFDGVELNIVEPEKVKPDDLKDFLSQFGLRMSMFASGASAKAQGLSLCSTTERERTKAVTRTREFLQFAGEFGAGVIAGFLKGQAGENSPQHRRQLAASIAELAPDAARAQAPLLIEAINRFESPLGHSLDDTYELLAEHTNGYLWILPDTWHMNIEESNIDAALMKHRDHFGSIHFSDNNRYLPGLGGLDFKRIAGVLDALEYAGWIGLEGKFETDLQTDVRRSMRYLAPVLE